MWQYVPSTYVHTYLQMYILYNTICTYSTVRSVHTVHAGHTVRSVHDVNTVHKVHAKLYVVYVAAGCANREYAIGNGGRWISNILKPIWKHNTQKGLPPHPPHPMLPLAPLRVDAAWGGVRWEDFLVGVFPYWI